jgi:hypothetical protein
MNNQLPTILSADNFNENSPDFQHALFNLRSDAIRADNFHYLVKIYQSTKQLPVRNKVLRLLYNFSFPALEAFFMNVYTRERYLDMKISALRGLAQFIPEAQLSRLLVKFNQVLAKRQQTTP